MIRERHRPEESPIAGAPSSMLKLLVLALAIGFALAVTVALLVAVSDTQAETVTVAAGNNWYCDSSYENGICETTVNVGDTVTWEIVEGIHTVTECDDTFSNCPPAGGGFGSGILSSGDTFSHTFTEPDTVEYLCTLHPQEMRGRIIVQAPTPTPDTPTPTPSPPPSPSPTPGPTAGPTPTEAPTGLPATGGQSGGDGAGFAWWVPAAGIVLILSGTALVGRRVRS